MHALMMCLSYRSAKCLLFSYFPLRTRGEFINMMWKVPFHFVLGHKTEGGALKSQNCKQVSGSASPVGPQCEAPIRENCSAPQHKASQLFNQTLGLEYFLNQWPAKTFSRKNNPIHFFFQQRQHQDQNVIFGYKALAS